MGSPDRPTPTAASARRDFLAGMTGRVQGGSYGKEATVKQLPISKGIAGVSMRLEPGVMRELHWHATAAEWAYVVSGRVRTTVVDPQGYGHSLENIGPDQARILIVFNSGTYETVDVSQWIAGQPADVLAVNFGRPAATFEAFPKRDVFMTQN
jgi:oxalate decarboxylase